MTRSMTGYGRAEAVLTGRKFTVEMKSVNHRYLETSLRLPGILLPLETEIKKRIGEQFSRGRIEATFRSMMAGFRDAFVTTETVQDPETLWDGLSRVLDEAIRMLTEMREQEGESLKRDLTARLSLIAGFLEVIAGRTPQVVLEYQKRLVERIRELTGGMAIDEARLLQEVAIMAEKSDITEEIVRFRSHIDQFTGLLTGGDAAGRKIDFLIQEMGREINTIGSKSGDAEISRNVIEVKGELAKLRECVQNIE